jgi:hypothetical protein
MRFRRAPSCRGIRHLRGCSARRARGVQKLDPPVRLQVRDWMFTWLASCRCRKLGHVADQGIRTIRSERIDGGRAPRRAIVTARSPRNGQGVVRPADPRREQRLARCLAPALVSGAHLGTSPRAHLSIGAVLASAGGPALWANSGHLKRGQVAADRPVNASRLPRMCESVNVTEFSAPTGRPRV